MNELERRYRLQLAALRQQVLTALRRLYGETVTPDDLDAAFAAFNPRAASLLRAGQSRGISLATAYLAALISVESGRRPDLGAFTGAGIIGTTAEGMALEEGMDAFRSMVKSQIGKGAEVDQALDFGRAIAERFTDAELTSAVDRHTDAVTAGSGEFSGWEGIVSALACDPCQGNSGFHELSESMYRHGSCNCTKQYVVAP